MILKKEQPLINHRIRKAALHGAKVYAINPLDIEVNYELAGCLVAPSGNMLHSLMEVLKSALDLSDKETLADCPVDFAAQISHISPSKQATDIAKQLMQKQQVSIILGAYVLSHPQAHQLYWLARVLAHLTQASFGEMSFGANSAGGNLAGSVPHRLPFGKEEPTKLGLSAHEMFKEPRQGYVLVGCEPELDCACPKLVTNALKQAKAVVVLSAFDSPEFREYADVLLPITPISEMAGTYINALGQWQNFEAAVNPFAQSRPAWKVLRVMANLWEIPGFDYQTTEDILLELEDLRKQNPYFSDNVLSMACTLSLKESPPSLLRLAPVGLYQVDGITRRADALQQTIDAKMFVKLNSVEAQNRSLKEGQHVWVVEGTEKSTKALPLEIDNKLPMGVAVVTSGAPTQTLGAPFSQIEIQAAINGEKVT